MTASSKRKARKDSTIEVEKFLDILLALDRTLIEFSMLAYNVPPRLQSAMREQNRLLHEAIKKY